MFFLLQNRTHLLYKRCWSVLLPFQQVIILRFTLSERCLIIFLWKKQDDSHLPVNRVFNSSVLPVCLKVSDPKSERVPVWWKWKIICDHKHCFPFAHIKLHIYSYRYTNIQNREDQSKTTLKCGYFFLKLVRKVAITKAKYTTLKTTSIR